MSYKKNCISRDKFDVNLSEFKGFKLLFDISHLDSSTAYTQKKRELNENVNGIFTCK